MVIKSYQKPEIFLTAFQDDVLTYSPAYETDYENEKLFDDIFND